MPVVSTLPAGWSAGRVTTDNSAAGAAPAGAGGAAGSAAGAPAGAVAAATVTVASCAPTGALAVAAEGALAVAESAPAAPELLMPATAAADGSASLTTRWLPPSHTQSSGPSHVTPLGPWSDSAIVLTHAPSNEYSCRALLARSEMTKPMADGQMYRGNLSPLSSHIVRSYMRVALAAKPQPIALV